MASTANPIVVPGGAIFSQPPHGPAQRLRQQSYGCFVRGVGANHGLGPLLRKKARPVCTLYRGRMGPKNSRRLQKR